MKFSHKITENCERLKSILIRGLGPLCKQGKEIRSAEIVKHSLVKICTCSRPPLICKAGLRPHCVLPIPGYVSTCFFWILQPARWWNKSTLCTSAVLSWSFWCYLHLSTARKICLFFTQIKWEATYSGQSDTGGSFDWTRSRENRISILTFYFYTSLIYFD